MSYTAAISMATLGGILGAVLAFAGQKLQVETDPRVEEVLAVLPGANCGSCGFPGCSGFAAAVVKDEAPVNGCVPGKEETAAQIARILGREPLAQEVRNVARVLCQGGTANARDIYQYNGLADCHAAVAQFGGPKDCAKACVGLGSCAKVCPFGAIKMNDEGLPDIDPERCTGCGVCITTCPKKVLELIPSNQLVMVACRNREKAKRAKESCQVACIKCKICEKNCPTGAIKVIADNEGSVAVIDYNLCDNCGICVEKCPVKIIAMHEAVSSEIPKPPVEPVGHDCASCGLCGGAAAK